MEDGDCYRGLLHTLRCTDVDARILQTNVLYLEDTGGYRSFVCGDTHTLAAAVECYHLLLQ